MNIFPDAYITKRWVIISDTVHRTESIKLDNAEYQYNRGHDAYAAIFLCLFYINHTLYSNVISMVPFLLLFQLSILCCALASKTKRNFFQIIAALIIFTEVALFHLYSPPYSVSKAISTVQNSKSSLIIRQNKEYATMSTTVYLNPFVKAGYVFRCFDNDANKQYNIYHFLYNF